MRELPGRARADDVRSQGELERAMPGEHLFSCLGGIDFESPSPRVRKTQRAFRWALAACPVGLIVLLVFAPIYPKRSPMANEMAAILTLQVVQQAEAQYQSTYPDIGYACSLSSLGGDSASGAPSSQAAQILKDGITHGIRSGYILRISNCTKDPTNHTSQVTGFTVIAVPQVVGKTGKRGFCANQSGPLRFDPAGGTDCTQEVQ
jgi:type IV pilus assembly protein PilA